MLTTMTVNAGIAWAGLMMILLGLFQFILKDNVNYACLAIGLVLMSVPYILGKLYIRKINADEGHAQFMSVSSILRKKQ